jgi:hypothetical protein
MEGESSLAPSQQLAALVGNYGFHALQTQTALMSLALLEPWLVPAGSAHGNDDCCRILGHPSPDDGLQKTLRAKLANSSSLLRHEIAHNRLVDNMS